MITTEEMAPGIETFSQERRYTSATTRSVCSRRHSGRCFCRRMGRTCCRPRLPTLSGTRLSGGCRGMPNAGHDPVATARRVYMPRSPRAVERPPCSSLERWSSDVAWRNGSGLRVVHGEEARLYCLARASDGRGSGATGVALGERRAAPGAGHCRGRSPTPRRALRRKGGVGPGHRDGQAAAMVRLPAGPRPASGQPLRCTLSAAQATAR